MGAFITLAGLTLKSCSVRINTNGSGYSASYFTFTNWHGGNGGDGGGLHNAGTLVVLDSSIAENKAGDGGDGGNNDYGGGLGVQAVLEVGFTILVIS